MSLVSAPPLFAHQSRGVEFLVQRQGIGALFMECGTGKTRTVLESYAALRQRTPGIKLIVFAPLSLLNTAWKDDIAAFTDFSYLNAHDEDIPGVLGHDITPKVIWG